VQNTSVQLKNGDREDNESKRATQIGEGELTMTEEPPTDMKIAGERETRETGHKTIPIR
jgi:hypothetical protein